MKTALTNAEVELQTARLEWPTSQYTRHRALESMMTTSNYYWHQGKILPYTQSKQHKEIKKKVKKGTAPTIEEALLEQELARARKRVLERPDEGKTAEEIAAWHVNHVREQAEVPPAFYLTNVSKRTVIWTIPDNAEPDFLALCVEYLESALLAKTDFTEKTILNKKDQKLHFGESGNGLNEKELVVRKEMSNIIGQILADADGEPFPPTPEKAKKELEDWNNHYSPAARARRANMDNESCRKAAAEILADLRSRNLIQ